MVSLWPVRTVCCERWFKLMNIVKNKFISFMQDENVTC